MTVWMLGPVGALLAMPISVPLVLVLRRTEGSGWAATLLARDPADDPARQ